ncbi:hypothetical protein GJ654_03430 [Rhodoblastus acidophilus]|uniref:Uncharacterized protein n=1 Tax=Rhodoblastus acidophilus TaxID=1074 RepID=A0A6N8DHW5_RHOAC|nr:hypothetical protein [Rhodoblastus acidophilus]MTV30042.1 hypothetical protein [Rhodoblastus acidophilus]
MKRPVTQILFAALLGLAVLFSPVPRPAEAAPVAPSNLLATQSYGSAIQQTQYYYRRHYYRPYYRHYYRPYRPYYRPYYRPHYRPYYGYRPHYWHRRHYY